MFDATATTSSLSGVDPYRQVTYSFDFGDERGERWAISGLPKNTQTGGPLAAHVFDVPGTYTVRVRAIDSTGASTTASMTVTVHNADSVYSGNQTVCVSQTANYAGCPSGALTQTGLPASYSGKRVLLRRGESFGQINIRHGERNVIVGAFGSGNKPRVTSVRIGSGRPDTASFAEDITVMDLNIADGIVQDSSAARLLLYRNDLADAGNNNRIWFGAALDYWAGSDPYRNVSPSQFYNPREIFIVENRIQGGSLSNDSPILGTGSRIALLGNDMGYANQHTVRIGRLHKGVMAHNAMRGRSSDGIRHALKLHSGGLDSYTDSYNGSTWATRQVVIANNLFGDAQDNNQWTVAVSPQNGVSAEGLEDVIVENNRFVRGTRTVTDLVITGRRMTYRGNVRVDGGSLGVSTNGHGEALPADWRGPYYGQ
ncbi:MAG: hypothetical protein KatS3mg122_0623 [Caldimonas sp.]|nr:MAG: hypothetical protein KatS3mg122_0623 [Caldimonas sp.]